jgi:hypothetical protein
MRCISFPLRKRLSFSGNVNASAIALGDVDNDGDNELVIGNIQGDLCIFKYNQPWRLARDLGTITSIATGDLVHPGKNALICISAEGFCHIFDLQNHTYDQSSDMVMMTPNLKLPIPVNISRVLISDIDGDGQQELVVARTDRYLHAYALQFLNNQLSPIPKPMSIASAPATESRPMTAVKEVRERTVTSTSTQLQIQIPNKDLAMTTSYQGAPLSAVSASSPLPGDSSSAAETMTPVSPGLGGESLMPLAPRASLFEKHQWLFSGQLGALATDGGGVLYVGQPGGQVTAISADGQTLPLDLRKDATLMETTTEVLIVGEKDEDKAMDMVCCTMDGSIQRYTLKGNKVIPGNAFQVDHPLFSLQSVSVDDNNGPGTDLQVACAWDGTTVIFNEQHAVRFPFKHRVCAFAVGQMAMQPGRNEAVLVYVTFNDEVLVYHDLKLSKVFEGETDFWSLLEREGRTHKDQDKESQLHAIRQALYQGR